MTKAVQETEVGEGLALGLVSLGVQVVSGSKQSVEFAFQRAWDGWAYRHLFPAVRADVMRNDLLRILGKSPGRRSAHLAGWSGSWPFVPYVQPDWTLQEVGELAQQVSGVGLQGWTDLSRAFAACLQELPGATDEP